MSFFLLTQSDFNLIYENAALDNVRLFEYNLENISE